MNEKELIQEIYKICMYADYRHEGHIIPDAVLGLIDEEAPELGDRDYQQMVKFNREG